MTLAAGNMCEATAVKLAPAPVAPVMPVAPCIPVAPCVPYIPVAPVAPVICAVLVNNQVDPDQVHVLPLNV